MLGATILRISTSVSYARLRSSEAFTDQYEGLFVRFLDRNSGQLRICMKKFEDTKTTVEIMLIRRWMTRFRLLALLASHMWE
jgi:hypothetical protein